MESSVQIPADIVNKGGISLPKVLLIVLVTILVTLSGSYWFRRPMCSPESSNRLNSVQKNNRCSTASCERWVISLKTAKSETIRPSPKEFDERGLLKPERYSKVGAKREISFNEHKLNALLARNTNLARKLAIDLSQNLVAESGGGPGFWKSFSEGVEDIRVEDGRIKIKLKE
ncbi:MAG: hypothetical protein NTU74_13195 [Deltaproteobacteria bacterium]|nr:hypothetical protein [Deltaproteobacteria bacterium]